MFKGGWMFWAISLLIGFLLINEKLYANNASIFGKPFAFISYFALFYSLIGLSNRDALQGLIKLEDISRMDNFEPQQILFYFLGLGVVISVTYFGLKQLKNKDTLAKLIAYLPFLIAFLMILYYTDKELDFDLTWLGRLIFNLYVLGFGVSALVKGANEKRILSMFYGLFLICWLLWARYFDMDISFWLKGIIFIGVGGAFFMINYIFSEELTYEEEQYAEKSLNEEEE